MSAPVVDLNADLGEGFDDAALLAVVTSANVACGFHAGDAATMRRVCELAVERGVAVGAQVSYLDRDGFGRRSMDIASELLAEQVAEQVAELAAHAAAAGTSVTYAKPHGALYNRAAHDPVQAQAVVAGVVASGVVGSGVDAAGGAQPVVGVPVVGLPVLGLPGSALHAAALEAGLPVVAEAFVDRGYTAQGTLVPRGEPGAVVTEPGAVVARALDLAMGRAIAAVSGEAREGAEPGGARHLRITVKARSLCLHGDTPGAALLGAQVRAALEQAGVHVRSFTEAS